jgi:hypothetical protein
VHRVLKAYPLEEQFMRRLLTPVASLLATGVLLVSPATAHASAERSPASEDGARFTTRVNVTSPSAIRRGAPARYTFKVTNPNQIHDKALVLLTDFPRKVVSKVRFVTKPKGAKCGTQKHSSAGNYSVYCVVRSLHHTRITMSFNVWIKSSYYGKYRVGHYWAPVTLDSGGSVQDYLDRVGRDDLIGHAWTKVR